jgi:hypothetical protein
MLKSIKYPNKTDTGICRTCSSLKFFLRIMSCRSIKRMLNPMVNSPSVGENFRLSTYGIDEIGDVPSAAFVTILTPRELINKPTKNIRYRFVFSILFFPYPATETNET